MYFGEAAMGSAAGSSHTCRIISPQEHMLNVTENHCQFDLNFIESD